MNPLYIRKRMDANLSPTSQDRAQFFTVNIQDGPSKEKLRI